MPKQKPTRPATDQPAGPPEAEKNSQRPFKPQRVDLTPQEALNIGYVGGVRMPKTKE